MSKHCRRPGLGEDPNRPSLDQCRYHRCERHGDVKQLNATEPTDAECGACIAEEMLAIKAQLLLSLDGYAERMIYAHALRQMLASARDRLNLLSPGAGDEFALAAADPEDVR